MPAITTVAAVATRVLTAAPRCGTTRLVGIDGPSGAGKTEFARRLCAALGGVPVVHMDDLYPGWDGLERAVALLAGWVAEPLAAGRPARYRRYDWDRGAFAEDHDLGTPPLLVVEGVGAGARVLAARAALLVWIEAPPAVRRRRAMERDGETYRPHWDRWAAQEQVHHEAEETRCRADVRISTGPTTGTFVDLLAVGRFADAVGPLVTGDEGPDREWIPAPEISPRDCSARSSRPRPTAGDWPRS